MPDIKLGPTTGTATTLPPLRWMSSPPSLPINQSQQLQRATMSDGSRRYSSLGIKREWPHVWEQLSAAELASLQALNVLSGVLKYQNNWESATWYDVAIILFDVIPLVGLHGGADIWYSVSMTVEEI